MTAGYFQTAKRVGGPLAETEETAMQPVPKPVAVARAKARCQFQCQRPVTGTNQILAQLDFIRRENADATPTA